MVERCPACRAKNPGRDVCRRCHADLHWLTCICVALRYEEHQMVQCLLQNKMTKAHHHLNQAMRLNQTGLTQALAGFLKWGSRSHPPLGTHHHPHKNRDSCSEVPEFPPLRE